MKKDTILHTMTKLLVRNWRTPVRSAAYSSALTSAQNNTRNLSNNFFPHWEQNIPTLGMKYSQAGNKMGLRLASDEITSRASRDYGSLASRLRLVVTLLLMLFEGMSSVKAQTITDYSGVYNIANHIWNGNNTSSSYYNYNSETPEYNWYLVPARDPHQNNFQDAYFCSTQDYVNGAKGNPETPFLTTYRTKGTDQSDVISNDDVWIVTFAATESGTDYYYIIHARTGKYVKYQLQYSGGNAVRKSVHLESVDSDTPGDDFKFKIVASDTGLNIRPKNNSGNNLNPAGDNWEYYYAHSNNKSPWATGLVGHYSGTTNGSIWHTEDATLAASSIIIDDVSSVNNKVTVTVPNWLPAGYKIRYNIGDGSQLAPTASTSTYIVNSSGTPNEIPITESGTLKVVIERYGVVLTGVKTKEVEPYPMCGTPQISFDNSTNEVTITPATVDDAIFYTIDNSTPSSNSTPYSVPFSISPETTVKAIATHSGFVNSEVATLTITKVATPTILNDGTIITISCATANATIYYTTDGSDPLTSGTKQTYIDPIPVSGNEGKTFKAIAVMAGWFNSDESDPLTVTAICPMPTISFSNSNGEITLACSEAGATIYYTLDGTTSPDPTQAGGSYPTKQYNPSSKPTISATTTIKAVATKAGFDNSIVAERTIEQLVAPSLNFDGASLLVTVTVNSTVEEVSTVYTDTGSDPTISSTVYTVPIAVTENKTIKAMNVKDGYVNSEIATLDVDLSNTGYSGIYYLQNKKDTKHNLYPSTGSYVKTANNNELAAVWKLVRNGAYYYIIHYEDNKYMKADGNYPDKNAVTLVETPDDNCLFELIEIETEIFNIKPKDASRADNKNYLNPSGGVGNNIGLYTASDDASKWKFVNVPVAPTITVSDINVTFTNNFGSGDVYYTYQIGSAPADPTKTVTVPSTSLQLAYGPKYYIKAVTIYDEKGDKLVSSVADKNFQVNLILPQFTVSDNTVTITNSQASGVTFRYTHSDNGNDPVNPGAPSGNGTDGSSVTLTPGKRNIIKAIAYNTVEGTTYKSAVATFIVDLRDAITVSSFAQIDSPTAKYKLSSTFTASESDRVQIGGKTIGSSDLPFSGTIEGYVNETTGEIKPITLSKPLFECVENATIKNIVVAQGDISGNGAIAGVAKGQTRIYNCGYLGGTITGSGNVGGIVGEIQNTARVINCFSFATVSGGSLRGGIVGNNNVTTASRKGSINTMVMNCMFYGTISGGGAPIYNGTKITNAAGSNGLNNFNYYSYDDFEGTPSPYNCALAAEKIYLERFEFHRNILNSNHELAAWYATGSTSNSNMMAKWVLDKSIAKYPILKKQGYYPSVINYEDAPSSATISVSVSQGNGAPTGASIGSCPDRKIYDKDIEHHHYNHKTIRLPYYWEVGGTGNYTHNKVMTGWEVSVSGGKNFTGSFTHNYANRDYSAYSGRVFSQGAYLDIPEGATSVSITSHWADCVYLSDPTYDVTYNIGYTPTYVGDMGVRYDSNKQFNGQTVYTTFADAVSNLNTSSGTVYDNAIVLVGNYHQYCKATSLAKDTGPFTVMSADLNNDSEPDYTFFYQHSQRRAISPVRFDFLNFPGVGLGQKVDGTYNMAAQGIFQPQGWFEVTNTCLVHFTQFEYDLSKDPKTPVILLGGIYDQFVSGNTSVGGTSYIHLGSNAYFPNDFCNGTHVEKTLVTPHIPISVTGGEYRNFYLSGMYRPDVTPAQDNALCYIDGGYFTEEVAGAGQEKIDGNVTWYIANADITNFYGGGINDQKSITGAITVNIKDSRVDEYCGGPKFGNMATGKKVTTTADDCTFGKYFGAGYGGTSFYRYPAHNEYQSPDYSWDTWASEYTREYKDNLDGVNEELAGISTSYEYEYVDRSGAVDNNRVGRFYINYASLSLAETHDVESTLTGCTIKSDFYGGGNLGKVSGDIESKLTDCTVYGSVFGGGFSATPPTVEVWPTTGFVQVPTYNGDAGVYNEGDYPDTEAEGMVVYTWSSAGTNDSPFTSGNKIHTDKDLTTLGQVKGDTKLTIDGDTYVQGIIHGKWDDNQDKLIVDSENTTSSSDGGVFGGGDASAVLGKAEVIVKTTGLRTLGTAATATYNANNVFGGGNSAKVGETDVTIQDDAASTVSSKVSPKIQYGVFGGGNKEGVAQTTVTENSVSTTYGTGNAQVSIQAGTIGFGTVTTKPLGVYGGSNSEGTVAGTVTVSITGGTIGTNATSTANVHGGGYGSTTATNGNVSVTVNGASAVIWGDVYGGSALGSVNSSSSTTTVTLTDGTINGSLYGGGLGDTDNAALINGNVTVTVNGGKVQTTTNENRTTGAVFGCNNVNGTPKGTVTVTINGTAATVVNEGVKTYALQGVYGGGNLAHYDPTDDTKLYPTVTVNGCNTSIKDVFGGGNAAAVPYTSVTINGGDIDRVFAGGNGSSGAANVGYKNSKQIPTAGENEYGTGTSNAIIAGGTINEIYGGSNNKGTVRATGTMNITKSTEVGACPMKIGSVYGGGNEAPGAAVSLTIGCTGTGDDEGITNVFGGANAANVTGNILLNITEGKIANVFGGNNSSGNISGTITVNINKAASPCVWNIGNVFGGGKDAAYSAPSETPNYPVVNIKNGTVSNVFGGGQGTDAIVTGNPQVTIGDATDGYEADVTGDVYGGGDAAAVTGTPVVHVINKDNTNIGNVYGGGNAANVSATSVTIDGGTTGMVFGGGHGDKASLNGENETTHSDKTANVTGNVNVSVTGGTITKVFAGSNLNGSIGGTVELEIDKDANASTMKIGEVYGGGNEAAGNAGEITIGCTGTWTETGENNHTNHNSTTNRIGYELEGIGTVYGGANAADIGTSENPSNITLNVNSGIVENVFGGNNASGAINGTIEVNIEKTSESNTCSWYVGNVYGGGNLASYSGTPQVNIKNGTVSGNVYGGGLGNSATVGATEVIVGDLTAANSAYQAIVSGDVYGGGDAAPVTGSTSVTLQKTNSSVRKLFGGGNAAGVTGSSSVTMTLGTVTGGIYGGCNSSGSVGAVMIALNGGLVGTDETHRADVFGGGYGHPTTTTGDVTLNIGTATTSGGTTTYSGSAVIYGDVYGGSALGQVNGSGSTTILNINSNSIHGTIYGGGMGSGTSEDTKAITNGNIQINYNTANTDLAGFYGGANANGNVVGNIEVNVKADLGASGADRDLFGGGLGAATSTNGNVTVNIGDLTSDSSNNPVYNPVVFGNIYGGSSLGSVNDAVADLTTVNILSGTIHGNTYGGGLGEAGEANVAKGQVNGTVIVNIGSGTVNSTTGFATTTNGFATFVAANDGSSGSIYGCNNTNGSPKGNVTVNVYQTAHTTTDEASYTGNAPTYAIDQVFGGGNQANYSPTSSDSRATVHVYTCDNTVRRVFGGGNAAEAVGVVTQIDGGHFDYVYGGGNGEVTDANIGAGGTNLQIHGGKINYLFGGSNARGTISGNMGVSVDNNSGCGGTESTQYVNEFFCGNNLASIGTPDGDPVTVNATIACGTKFGAVYGGCNLAPLYGSVILTVEGGEMDYVYGGSKGRLADNSDPTNPIEAVAADISGDVTLTIKGGKIKNVFGGSNINGNIAGSIEVNIEKDDTSTCNDGWYVGNVYGASNLAAYTPTNDGNTLKVNIKNGIVSGNVYGGGKGTTATVTSNPVVTIGDVTTGHESYVAIVADDANDKDVNNAAFVGGNVYGGGDAAPVVGNTTVTYNDNNSNTTVANIYGGGNNASVSGNATVTLKGKATVEGDVFGGGNEGIVGGTATVNIEE